LFTYGGSLRNDEPSTSSLSVIGSIQCGGSIPLSRPHASEGAMMMRLGSVRLPN
jgi:hypothetical protein